MKSIFFFRSHPISSWEFLIIKNFLGEYDILFVIITGFQVVVFFQRSYMTTNLHVNDTVLMGVSHYWVVWDPTDPVGIHPVVVSPTCFYGRSTNPPPRNSRPYDQGLLTIGFP